MRVLRSSCFPFRLGVSRSFPGQAARPARSIGVSPPFRADCDFTTARADYRAVGENPFCGLAYLICFFLLLSLSHVLSCRSDDLSFVTRASAPIPQVFLFSFVVMARCFSRCHQPANSRSLVVSCERERRQPDVTSGAGVKQLRAEMKISRGMKRTRVISDQCARAREETERKITLETEKDSFLSSRGRVSRG